MIKSIMHHSTTYLSPFLAPTPHAFKRSGVGAFVLSGAFTSKTRETALAGKAADRGNSAIGWNCERGRAGNLRERAVLGARMLYKRVCV